ncbi:MAG: DUF1579 domain-containing protein [Phycisphaerales bacterium]
MKSRKNVGWLVAALALSGFAAGVSSAQDSHKDKGAQHAADPHMSPEQAAEMEAWMKAAAITENHERLNYFVGTWNTTVKSWMAGPDSEPMTSSGTSRCESIMGGRYIKDSFKGDFMGEPFEGMGLTGYDNVQGHYVGTWIDSMGTGMMHSKGSYDAASKSYTFHAAYPDPVNPGKMKKMKEIIKIVSDSEYTFTMFDIDEKGAEIKQMEITYKRS